jgi:hypothetical protein
VLNKDFPQARTLDVSALHLLFILPFQPPFKVLSSAHGTGIAHNLTGVSQVLLSGQKYLLLEDHWKSGNARSTGEWLPSDPEILPAFPYRCGSGAGTCFPTFIHNTGGASDSTQFNYDHLHNLLHQYHALQND